MGARSVCSAVAMALASVAFGCQWLLSESPRPAPEPVPATGDASARDAGGPADASGGPFRCPPAAVGTFCSTFDTLPIEGTFTSWTLAGAVFRVLQGLGDGTVASAVELTSVEADAHAGLNLEQAQAPIACDFEWQLVGAPEGGSGQVTSVLYAQALSAIRVVAVDGTGNVRLVSGSDDVDAGPAKPTWNHLHFELDETGAVSASHNGAQLAVAQPLASPPNLRIGLTGEAAGWTLRFANAICRPAGAGRL